MADEQIKRGLDNFASPNLRVGFLLDDHPGATYRFDEMLGSSLEKYDMGVAKHFPDVKFIVCLIDIPDGTTHVGWKPLPKNYNEGPENYVALQTKTLGRALKRAGYPDNMGELRALVLWRHRNAALRGDGTAELEQAFDAARTIADDIDADLADVMDDAIEQTKQPDVVFTNERPNGVNMRAPVEGEPQPLRDEPAATNVADPSLDLDAMLAADTKLSEAFNGSSPTVQQGMRDWMAERKTKTSRTTALAWLRHLNEQEDRTTTATVDPDAERRALADALREKVAEWEKSDPARYDEALAKLVAAGIFIDEAELSEEDVDKATRLLFFEETV
jgi:hypothetical protein